MSRLRLSFPAVVLALASLACGGGQKCGEGTHEEGGECVPDEGGGDTSGDGGDDSGSDSGDDSASDSGDDSASDTYTVCGDARGEYLTLAEAVAGLGSGGTITMCEGTFAGADFQDGEFEVIGAGADATWIDLGEQTGITLRGSTVRIESLTLTATPDGEEPSVELFDSTLELRDGAVSGVVGAEGGYNVAFFSLDSAMLDIDHWVFEDLVLRQSLVSERDPEDTLHIRRTVFRDIVEEGRTALISYAEGEFQLTNLIFHRVEMAKVGSVLSTDYADEGDEYVRFLVFYDVTGGPSTYPRAELTILENVRWADPSNCHYCAVTDSDFTAADLGDEGSEDLDCRLVDPENGDFRLESSSPCRDFVSHYEDVDGSDADIGAYGGPYGAW